MDGVFISRDPTLLQLDWIVRTLGATYWATGRTRETVAASLRQSRCYGGYRTADQQQVALARVVTDGVTFAWLCDVVVDPEYRGRGLGKTLVSAILDDPELATVTFHLATKDAHGLYTRFGFAPEETLRRPRRHPRPAPGRPG